MRRERFPRHWLQRQPLVSDPGMHHDTCVTHVPWCMSGSLTRHDGENVPGIPGACATLNFRYLASGPWCTCRCFIKINHNQGTKDHFVKDYSIITKIWWGFRFILINFEEIFWAKFAITNEIVIGFEYQVKIISEMGHCAIDNLSALLNTCYGNLHHRKSVTFYLLLA